MPGFHPNEYGCLGTLDVDGTPDFPLNCVAWDVVNLDVLWTGESFVGENAQLPRVVGSRGYPRRLAEGEWNLIIWVRGDVDKDGNFLTDHWQGHKDNLADLWTNVFAPVDTGSGTRDCTLTSPDGLSTETAAVQFEPLRQQGDLEDPNEGIYTFRIVIPDGRFA